VNKKVYATKSESTASIIGKVLNASGKDVVLYIPRGTVFSKTRNNFLLLKREARAIGKNVSIESVDDDVLELAITAGLEAANPFLGKKQRSVSDIIAVTDASSGIPKEVEVNEEKDEEFEEIHIKKWKPDKWAKGKKQKEDKFSILGEEDVSDEKAEEELSTMPKGRKGIKVGRFSLLRRVILWGGGLSVFAAVVVVAIFAFPRVTVSLDFEKTEWDFIGSLKVGTSIKENNFDGDTVFLRGVRFSEKKNITESYHASGVDFVERKARGIIIVYNAFSSESQELVKTTRFVTPEGKIYRTDNNIVVPGAQIIDSEIVPSGTEVRVTADEAGEEFNIGSVPRFRIPGFQGSPKYDGFYGESTESMIGGFVGERKVPTDEDISSARAEILSTIEDAAKTQLFLNLPPGMKVLDGTYGFSATDENIDDYTDDSEMFSIIIFGEASVVVFREDELIEVFENHVEIDAEVDLAVKDYTIEYGEPRIDESGQVSVAIKVESVWTRPFDIEEFISEAAGKSESELKTLIFSIPGVSSGEVRFWPFWVNKVPNKDTKIIVDVN